MIRALVLAAAATIFAAALAGCGQKGPLKLPEPSKLAKLVSDTHFSCEETGV